MNVATMMRRLEEGGFTPGQATALAEVLHDEVVERIATKEDLARLETTVAKDIAHVGQRLDRVETELQRMDGKIDRLRDDLDQKIDRLRDDLDQKIDRFRDELEQKIDHLRGDLEQKIDHFRGGLEQKIDRSRDDLEQKLDLMLGQGLERTQRLAQADNRATIKWVAGMMIVQTAALLTGVIGLVKLLLL